MNIYEPTGKKLKSWPQWVTQLSDENLKLKQKVEELSKENLELKRRCCDLFTEVMETNARHEA